MPVAWPSSKEDKNMAFIMSSPCTLSMHMSTSNENIQSCKNTFNSCCGESKKFSKNNVDNLLSGEPR
jgi:hypothetical protein